MRPWRGGSGGRPPHAGSTPGASPSGRVAAPDPSTSPALLPPCGSPPPLGHEDLSALSKRFHEVYRQTYGIDADAPAQIVSARVRVVRMVDKLSPRPYEVAERDASLALAGERAASFAEIGGFATTPVFDWSRLEPGCRLAGPAIVEGPDATIVVPPGYSAVVDRWRNVLLASAEA